MYTNLLGSYHEHFVDSDRIIKFISSINKY
jgi:hypothetical protein